MKKQRILIDCTCCMGRISGLERYTTEVVNRLLKGSSSEYHLVLPKCNFGIHRQGLTNHFFHISPFDNRLLNEWLFLPWIYFRSKASKVFFPGFPPSVFFLLVKAKLVRTVYDVVVWKFPETISFKTKYYTRILESIFIKRHDLIFTISENAAELIKEEFPSIKAPIINTYLGVSLEEKYRKDRTDISRYVPKSVKFILSVGTIEPRKNYPFLIRAFADVVKHIPDIKLIIAGRFGWGIEEVKERIRELNLGDSVVLTNAVSDNELDSLYLNSEFFVYPSIYEGFGLPVIEAMSKGKFVISSDRASLPEVVGNAGQLLGISSSQEWSNKIIEILNDKDLTMRYIKNIPSHIAKFSWDQVSQKIQREIDFL